MTRPKPFYLLFLATLVLVFNLHSVAAPAAPSHLQYSFAFSVQGTMPGINVTLTFPGDASGTSLLALPPGLGGGGAYPNITDLRAVSPGTVIADTDKPQVKRLTYPAGQPVSVAYRVIVTEAGQQREFSYSPEIERDHFSILGFQLFAVPTEDTNRPLTVETGWNALPTGWTLADSHGVRQPHQAFLATPKTLQNSVWAAGDYRLLHTLIRGKSFYVAVRGEWPTSDAQILTAFSKIVGAEREFWHDDNFEYYIVVLNPQEGDDIGISFQSSFYEAVPPKEGLGFVPENTLAHESFHAWLPYRIMPTATIATAGWFYEGFTVYYARLFQLRIGLISLQEYADDCNKIIRAYNSSPFRTISGQQFRNEAEHGFSDNRILRVAYQRGDLLAQHWNAQIRLTSHGQRSLDNAMLDLLRLAQTEHRPLQISDLVYVMRQYLHRDVSEDIQRYTEQGQTIVPDPSALGPAGNLVPTPTTLFDLGYSWSGSQHLGKITGVETASSAYRAGLRDGQRYLDADFKNGDPAKEAHITVKDQTGQRVISYYPAGKTVLMPQYKLKLGTPNTLTDLWFGIVKTPAR